MGGGGSRNNQEVLPLTHGVSLIQVQQLWAVVSSSVSEKLETEAGQHVSNLKFLVNYNCYKNVICIIFYSLSYV